MPRHPEILDACVAQGFRFGHNGPMGILPHDGWRTRGSSTFDPHGSVNHHTAGAREGLLPSLGTLLNGRLLDDGRFLPGPLCNAALARNACLHLIAAGTANHAGEGDWRGLTGNSSMWGLEVEHVGFPHEPVSEDMWDAMHRWHAACAAVSGFDPRFVCQHYEWARNRPPETQKRDFVREITDPDLFRQRVRHYLDNPGGNDVGTLEGRQAAELANADQRTKVIVEMLRDIGPNASIGRRTKEATLILRSLTGLATDADLEAALAPGTDVRALLKTLVEGAVLEGLRAPDGEHPGRGSLREPFKDLLREVLDERDSA